MKDLVIPKANVFEAFDSSWTCDTSQISSRGSSAHREVDYPVWVGICFRNTKSSTSTQFNTYHDVAPHGARGMVYALQYLVPN